MAIIQALWLLIVIAFDFSQRRVPNWLVLAGAVLALVALALHVHPQGADWTAAAGAGALAFMVMLGLYAAGLMGAGDVKFAGALGLWVGLHGLLPVWVISSLLAAAHGLLWMALQRWPVSALLISVMSDPRSAPPRAVEPAADDSADREPAPTTVPKKRSVPYAAYLAIATLVWMAMGAPPL